MFELTTRVSGFRELDQMLQRLPDDLRKGALVRAVNVGAEVIADRVRASAPVRADSRGIRFNPRLTRPQRGALRAVSARAAAAGGGPVQMSRREARLISRAAATLNAPARRRRPGYLRREIGAVPARQVGVSVVRARIGVGGAFYGLFVEFGTRKMAARPFLRPALYAAAPAAIAAMRARLEIEIAFAVRRLGWR